jgi:hypothetical protein
MHAAFETGQTMEEEEKKKRKERKDSIRGSILVALINA